MHMNRTLPLENTDNEIGFFKLYHKPLTKDLP